MIKLYKTYNNVKDVFVKPKLKFHIGLWKNSPNLPVWRSGPLIRFAKTSEYIASWERAKLKKGTQWNDKGKKNHPIISKIFKPVYQLPIWLAFGIYNYDLIWKTKFRDYRYEFPPQFTLVFFGLSISFWLDAPEDSMNKLHDTDYWECILNYLYKHDKDLIKTYKYMGKYRSYTRGIDDYEEFDVMDENYIKEPYKTIIKNIKTNDIQS